MLSKLIFPLFAFACWVYPLQACRIAVSPGKVIKEWRDENMPYQIKTVIIDPGHGGKDPGCLGSGSQEKHIALAIAQKLAARMRRDHPDIRVVLTRDKDVFIPLHERAAIANRNNADLFISIHCNFMPGTSATQGTETYVMGLHTAEYNLQVAKRENEAILLEDNYAQNYDYDPNSPEGHILLSMFQNAFMEQSILFAEAVESRVATHAQRRSRGVKQAGFVVLKATSMPSVLIETGFLSNPSEEQYLSSASGQEKIADGIAIAFSEYRMALEKDKPVVRNAAPSSPGVSVQYASAPAGNSGNTSPAVAPAPRTSKPVGNASTETPTPASANTANRTREAVQILYYVQLSASNKPPDSSDRKWERLPFPVEVIREKDLYKTRAYSFTTFDKAMAARNALRKLGFPDAFVTVYENGSRITLEAAAKKVR